MSKRSEKFWDMFFWILMWLGIIIILVWIILKMLGMINSPIWVEIIPYFGGVITIFSAAYYIGKIKQGVDYTARKVNDSFNRLTSIEQRFNILYHEHEIAMGRIKLNRH